MEHFDELSVIKRIEELRLLKRWSYYELAKRSEISQSTLTAMLKAPHVPTIYNLAKICNGFGISLTSFFSYLDDNKVDSLDVLDLWDILDSESRHLALIYMKGLAHLPAGEENEKL